MSVVQTCVSPVATTRPSLASSLPVKVRYRISDTKSRGGTNNATYDIYIAQLVQPEIIRRVGGRHEVPLRELGIDLSRGNVELVQDPLLNKTFISRGLGSFPSIKEMGMCV